jgi:hypothetical protein
VGGDAIGLVAYALGQRSYRELGDDGKAEVRAWCLRFLGLDTTGPAPRLAPVPRAAAPAEPSPAPSYPPAEELEALWAGCVPVTDDAGARSYLAGRSLDAVRLAELDLVRALPPDAASASWCPSWARAWPSRGLRLVVPLVDAHGARRSVLARTVTPSEELPPGSRKSEAPKGYARAGLVMAEPLAAYVLEHRAWVPGWPESEPRRIVVAEGEPDFLSWTIDRSLTAPLVLGIVGGSWTAELASALPSGSEIVVRTHDDDAGAEYATKIVHSLAERVAVRQIAIRLAPWFRMERAEDGRAVVTRRPEE